MSGSFRYAVATHVSEVPGPYHALRKFLLARGSVAFATHPFGYSGRRCSELTEYENGRETGAARICSPTELSIFRDVFANFRWFLRRRSETFIGIDNVNASCAIVLRRLGRTKRVIFYVIDYTHQRFKNPVLNGIYQRVDRFAARNADQVWNLSEAMQEVRARQGVPSERNLHVPFGVELDLIRRPATRDRRAVVMLGHLVESKGFQLAISAMTQIVERSPGATLHIIGDGPYAADLKRLVATLGLERAVTFYGALSFEEMYRRLPGWGVALAPYLETEGSYTYYADPGKPKEYLACGLPVIITDVPRIARRIASEPMGICIRYNAEELTEAVVRLTTDDAFYDRCVANALAFSADLDWDRIFTTALGAQ